MKKLFPLVLLFILSLSNLYAQGQKPSFNEGLLHFSKLIASGNFSEFRNDQHDLIFVDSLFIAAVNYYNGDISEALLCLTFTTLPFDAIPIKLPLTDTKIYMPLPSAGEKIYLEKNKNLPRRLFFDSPHGEQGDKDKLAHFFGNAFLSYNFPAFNLSKFMGIFVELFEYTFKVDGSVDKRDLAVNSLGDLFGKSLNRNRALRPSQVLSVYSLLYFRTPI